jgi:hypothetical protein
MLITVHIGVWGYWNTIFQLSIRPPCSSGVCRENNDNNNVTACPPMVSTPLHGLFLLWSKPFKNYEL